MTLIDVHSHFHPTRLVEALAVRQEVPKVETDGSGMFVRYGPDLRYPLRPEMSQVDAKLEMMDRAGIDRSVLSVTMPGVDGLGDDAGPVARVVNDQLAAETGGASARLAWVAVLPMDRPLEAAAELRRAVGMGARGAMIFSNVAGQALDLELHAPVFAAACDLDVMLQIHPTYPLAAHTMPGFEIVSSLGYLVDTSVATLRLVLGGLFETYPDLKLMICHAGSLLAYQAGRIDYQALHRPGGIGPIAGRPSDHLRRLYTDSICLSTQTLRFAVDFFGSDHVMMGSDHPQWPMEAGVETLRDTDLTADERECVEHRTAMAAFQWPIR